MGHKEGYILPKEVIFDKIQETIDLGGTGVLMQGGLHPDLKIEWYEDLFRSIKQRFTIHLHCLSAPEITNIAEVSGLSLRDTIARLRDAGLDSIPGGGAEILDDAVRHRISRLKCGTNEWMDVHRTAHQLGMRTTATMMFGCGETIEQRMNHFDLVRRPAGRDRRVHGFHSLDLPAGEHLAGTVRERRSDCGGVFEDSGNLAAVPAEFPERSILMGYTGLKDVPGRAAFGGNDVGSIMIEENVVSQAGARNHATEEDLRRLIRDAGFVPKQRDTLYRTYFLN